MPTLDTFDGLELILDKEGNFKNFKLTINNLSYMFSEEDTERLIEELSNAIIYNA